MEKKPLQKTGLCEAFVDLDGYKIKCGKYTRYYDKDKPEIKKYCFEHQPKEETND